MTGNGSPTPRKRQSHFTVVGDNIQEPARPMLGLGQSTAGIHSVLPLETSKFANQQARPYVNDSAKKMFEPSTRSAQSNQSVVDSLLAKISEQRGITRQSQTLISGLDNLNIQRSEYETSSSAGSAPITPAISYDVTPSTDVQDDPTIKPDAAEMLLLKKQLEMANSKIAKMDQELSQTRIVKQTYHHAVGPSSDADPDQKDAVNDKTICDLQQAFNSSTRPDFTRRESWPARSEVLTEPSATATGSLLNHNRDIWGNNLGNGTGGAASFAREPQPSQYQNNGWNPSFPTAPIGNMHGMVHPQARSPIMASQRGYPLRLDTDFRENCYLLNDGPVPPMDHGFLRGGNHLPSRPGSRMDTRLAQWPSYPTSAILSDGRSFSPPATPLSLGMFQGPVPYQPQPIGTRLSPEAAEFNLGGMTPAPWDAQRVSDGSSGFMHPMEPMNYRKLLDRNMSCNWKYIVDKIVCSNDQQASIFLQQKLKVGTPEQKFEIITAIIAQAYPLMVNRFGNFLIQRCFEHGTEEQVIAIANTIRGHTINLSMDAFGCHVIQKAFDSVPEEYKAMMVHELLRRIPETVTHRYSCHVWQKLFELRWSDSPPQIMKYVNEALRGMWHEVALGETGSLVVQNIFENCLEDDKRSAINEVLASIDVIAHGQFGNWCIQHICEHGAPADRSRAIDHIVRFATEYSIDQYASKVIEKCLKVGGETFLDRYLDRVCEGRPDRPRMPLIDIAGDQFGNYLVQWILVNAGPQHQEIVASQVRKHMVSLRGSKYGSRVAMLCCNPAVATRPGPPAPVPMRSYTPHVGRGPVGYNVYR